MTVREDEDNPPGSSSESESDDDKGPKPSDDTYVCVPRPGGVMVKPEAALDVGDLYQEPAAEHPEWPWIMQWGAWEQFREMDRSAAVREPDNFKLCTSDGIEGGSL